MSFLYIGSTGDTAGHSLITWAVAQRLVEKGLSIGFFKPFGNPSPVAKGPGADPDAILFKEALNLKDPLEQICPFADSNDAWMQKGTAELLHEIKSLACDLSRGKDALIVMGAKHIFHDDAASPVTDISFAAELKAHFVLINRYVTTSKSIYSILSIHSLLQEKLKGVILNRVPSEKLKGLQGTVIPALVKKGVPIITALPEDPMLSFRSLREISIVLQAEWMCDDDRLERPVGGMTVGSEALKGELKLFKRVYNKLILLEPFEDDSETEASGAPRSISGIVLTGGRRPAPQIVEAAKKADIPLLLIKADTFHALEQLEKVPSPLTPKDEGKLRHVTKLMDRDNALDRLLQSCGLIPS